MNAPRQPRRRRIAGERSAADRASSSSPSPPRVARARPVPRPARRPRVDEQAEAAPSPGVSPAPEAPDSRDRREPTGEPERRVGAARRPRLPALGTLPWRAIAAVVVLALGLGLAGWGAWGLRGGGEAALESAQRQATRAAGEAAETIFTFAHDDLDAHEEDSKALMTSSFAKEFDKVAPSLRDIAPQREFEVQAQAQDAGPVPCGDECSTDTVQVLVFVDQVQLIAGQEDQAPTVLGNRVVMTMTKDRGTWLVDDIRAL